MATVLTDPVVMGRDGAVLASVRAAEVALSVWQRRPSPDLTAILDELDLDELDDLELSIECPLPPGALAANLVVGGYSEDVARMMAADILGHAERLAAIAGTTRLKLRLEVVETDACRRFHADYVTWRLLTTYRGQATQWVRAECPDAVQQMQAGDVAIFKGRVLMDEPPILHRSPPIEMQEGQRLLLVIDPAIGD